ncbi:unnamed protein product [Brassica oleracea var. botrytis]
MKNDSVQSAAELDLKKLGIRPQNYDLIVDEACFFQLSILWELTLERHCEGMVIVAARFLLHFDAQSF